jgi:hypothetical protein
LPSCRFASDTFLAMLSLIGCPAPAGVTPEARSVPDPVLFAFAAKLPARFRVADLRNEKVGSGFAWGRGGPNADVLRGKVDLIFAVNDSPE